MLFQRALLAFLALPGVVAVLLPPFIGDIDPFRWSGTIFGIVVLLAGFSLLVWCVWDFYVAGKGTLAPWDPPEYLVFVGLYKYTRNPMYVAVLTMLLGWALLYGSAFLSIYGISFALIFHQRVVRYEEPWLSKTFGSDWQRYAAEVPRWLIR
jgi:protein-S-isoprenylcysteine O-methyltransferase Ste14